VVVAIVGTVRNVFVIDDLGDARVELTDKLSPAALAAGDLTAAMLDQETGIRGYALSGEDRFLEPYRLGRRNAEAALAQLNGLGLKPFRDELRAIEATARAWQEGYAEPTLAQVRSDPARARDRAEVQAGKERFDAFRSAVARLQTQLKPARENARDRLDNAARVMLAWVIFTGAVILLSVFFVARGLRKRLVVPLERLAARVRQVARGDFEHEVTADGALEVVNLAHDVDTMRARIVAELASLREAEAELKRSNAELEQFAYVASHDLQEPLRKVASFCQLLQQRYGGQLDERADQYIGFAVDGARRMQDLINDLLAFSRVGRFEQPHVDVDCNALVERVRSDLSGALEDAEIDVGPLPTVHGDAGLLRVVFQNLIGNAVKFRGDEPPVVRVQAERDGDFWRFSCSDNGIGIDPEYAERIFVLFQRLHPRSQYEGTGIGLAMCRKIVEYHGGRIWLGTGDGPGSTFYFTLPVQPEDR
ncbi:MAG TPA: ATP-binding protein, partial [Solirubrobacter sp.]|nr:ATP-binding protein [Solirubrobacter sp.]